jgi:rhodanese-related sulfurtransferase
MPHSPEFEAICLDAKTRIREISLDELLARREEFLLLDVREDREWAEDRMPDAIHLGKGVLERDIVSAVPKKDTAMVLYCGGGFRSALAADNLQRMGYSAVWSLAGGIKGWWTRR